MSSRRLSSPLARLTKSVRAGSALVLLACWPGTGTAPNQHVPDEYRLKAAFLVHFPQFVEWPPAVFDQRPTLTVCVVNPSPFGRALAELLDGEAPSGRKAAVHQIDGSAAIQNCHVLFVPIAADGRPALMKKAAALPILTVSDAPDFLDAGGIIQLRVAENKVRFDVSVTAAKQAGLSLSSQLLRLATNVRGGS